MPRNYQPVAKPYRESELSEAIEKVQKRELSIREAGLKYNIDKSLIWRKIHNRNTSKQGRKTVLSKEEEEDLADKIRIMAKWGWALTRKEIREMVHQYVVQNNIQNNFKGDYPGTDWLNLYFKRHNLVSKKMEQLEKSRREATSDPFIIYNFYDILEETLTALQLHDKPSHVFNLDETGFSSDPTRVKGTAGKGQKAHRIIQGSGKDNTTVLGCIFAAGDLLPPLIIFKGQNLWSSWKGTNDIPGTTYACSENGWIMTTIFNEYFAKFCQTVKERPLLLIFDGHVTHLDPATIKLAIRENVAILKLPPHTTDLLQPCDRSCFGPLKYNWNERLIAWQRHNQRPLSKSEFADLLGEIWREGLSKEVIQKSFKVTGIFPVNREAYPKHRLDPLKLERYNKMKSSTGSVLTPPVHEEPQLENRNGRDSPSLLEDETSSTSVIQVTEPETSPTTTLTEIGQNLQPELRTTTTTSSDSHNIPNPEASCSFENLQPRSRPSTTTSSDSHNIPNPEASCSFENLQPRSRPSTTTSSDSHNIPNPVASCSFENLQPRSRPSTPTSSDSHNIPNPEASCSFENLQPRSRPSTMTSSDSHNIPNPKASCSFETLLLSKIKYTKPMIGKRRKIDGKGKLLTSEEYLKSIENLENTRKIVKKTGQKKTELKKKKQKPKTTKRMSDTDTDIGEDETKPKKKPNTTKGMSDTDADIGEDEMKPKKKKLKPKTKNRASDTDTDIGEDETKPKKKKQKPKTKKRMSTTETDIGEDETKTKKKKQKLKTTKRMSDNDTDIGEDEIKPKKKPNTTKGMSDTDTDIGEDEIKPKNKKLKPKTKNRASDTDTDIGEDETKPKKKKQKPKTKKRKSTTETDVGEDETKTKKKKQKLKTTKGMSDTDPDIGEDEIPYEDESDLENVALETLIEDYLDEEYNKSDDEKIQMGDLDYGVGDFVLIGHKTKKGKSYYIARIQGSDNDDSFSVIYLKRAKKIFFIYPDTRIIYSIDKDEIVMKLPSPNKSKRGALMFDIDLEKYNIN